MATSWTAGEMFGHAIVEQVTKDPLRLDMEGPCTFFAQLAVAQGDGGYPASGEEGACIVTTVLTDAQVLPAAGGVMPACAGAFRVTLGSSSRNVTVCDAATFPGPIDLDCADVDAATTIRVTSGPDEMMGDVLSTLDLSTPIAPVPTITGPEPAGVGMALWPRGAVTVRWTPATAMGDVSVEIDVRRASGVGNIVRCFADDDGEFELPEGLVAEYRTEQTAVEVSRVSQARADVDGFDFRLSSKTSDAIQLIPNRGP